MKENSFIVKNGKRMRCGYTTGSCATAAAAAAARMLFSGLPVTETAIVLPGGERTVFAVGDMLIEEKRAVCSVIKDAGDDPDITDGAKIFAECAYYDGAGVTVQGGQGVGVVTGKGLRCPPGEAAINPVPRRMIVENVLAVCREYDYQDGLRLTISVPDGEALAPKTFNPRIGITGGISILGTTGIVEPMSEKALIDTIKLLIDKQRAADGTKILVSPGNYGREYCRENLGLDINGAVKCANFIGETLDYLVYSKFRKLLLVGHIGKLVKVAAGVMNTHSAAADARMEIFAAHSAVLGGGRQLARDIMGSLTTDQVIDLLEEAGLCDAVFAGIMEKILFHLNYRAKGTLEIGVIIFGAEKSKMYISKEAEKLLPLFK